MNIYPIILKNKPNSQGKVNIKIRVVHNRDVRDIGTEFYISPNVWSKGKVTDDHDNADYINLEISKTVVAYQEKLIGKKYKEWPISRIVDLFRQTKPLVTDFSSYFNQVIIEKGKVNKRNGEIYDETRVKIEKFDKRSHLLFEDITAGWLRRFEVHMREQGNKNATISLTMRNIRSAYNCAIDDQVTELGNFPFLRYKIPKGSDERVPLTLEQIKKLVSIQFKQKAVERARLAFLLSFTMIGINNSDMYELPPDAIQNGRVDFSRNKTSKPYSIKVEPEILKYLNELKGKKMLVNFADVYNSDEQFTHCINRKLKLVGPSIGYPGLIMYIARHTWSSIAKNELMMDDNDISSALGHTIKGVTQAYTHRNRKLVDDMNRKVLDKVFKEELPNLDTKHKKKKEKV